MNLSDLSAYVHACVGYVAMRKVHSRNLDSTVMHGAECNTHYMMLRVKLQLGEKNYRGWCVRDRERKFDVSNLQGRCVDERWRETAKGKFVREVNERMKDAWRSDGSVEEKWAVRRTVMCETAGSVLGPADRQTIPDESNTGNLGVSTLFG